MTPLAAPLNANAIFSLTSGLVLTAVPASVSDWLDVDAGLLIRAFGVVLIAHAVLLFWAARRPDPHALAMANLLAIAPYPLAMVGLAASGIIETSLGRALVLADGAVIAFIAIWHAALLRQNQRSSKLSAA